MRMLVTGGAGFIGSHLCRKMLDEGHEVICLDNFDPYYDPGIKYRNIQPCLEHENFSLIQGDIGDPATLSPVIEGADYVFHQAAQAGVRVSVENPRKTHTVNASGTLALLEAARESGVRKIINASSSSVYGKVQYLPFDENHPRQPISPYGVTKLIAEEYCRVFQELYGLPTISLRYFTVYGPRMRPDLAISIFTRNALHGEPLMIFGDGSKSRDFTHVDDVVAANMLAMNHGTGSYNIGGGNQITIQSLAETIIRITKSPSEIRYAGDMKGDADCTLADYQKAAQDLGWKPEVSLEDGLRRFAEWVSNCPS